MDNEKEISRAFDSLVFPKILQTFRVSVNWKNLIIAFLAVATICFAGWIMDLIVVATSSSEDKVRVFSTLWNTAGAGFHGAVHSLLLLDLTGVKAHILGYLTALLGILNNHYVYCTIFAAIKLAVLSVAGGAICRSTALQFAKHEKPGLMESLRYSTRRFGSFFTTPLAPFGIILFAGFFIFILGLMGNIPWAGQLIMAVFLMLALLVGVLIAVVLIGTLAGFNLMFPAVAYDGSDCFDAISRSFSYVYSRPWRMGFYTVIAAAYGAVCYMFVRFFAFLSLRATYWFLQAGVWGDNNKLLAIWQKPSFWALRGPLVSPEGAGAVATFIVHLWLLVVVGMVAAFVISFYFSANTIIYSLMRNKVDNTAFDDIYVEEIATDLTTPESNFTEELSQTDSDNSSSTQ
jgi:hypothetical protein